MAINPADITPVNIKIPGEGQVFRVSSSPDDSAYYFSGGKLYSINLSSLGQQYFPGGEQLGGRYNYRNGSWQAGKDALNQNFGVDFNSIPVADYNLADLQSKYAGAGEPGQIKTLISTPAAAPTTQTLNGPEVKADVEKQLAGMQTQNATGTTTTPPSTGTSVSGSTTQGSVQGTSTLQPPTANLQPGMTGDLVKQLQDWLVSQGYLTQAQVNTGYGIYGPQTTAAVAKWQTDNKVDNSTGPGFWGPKSIAAVQVQTAGTQSNTPQQSQAPATSDVEMNSKLIALGLTQDQINSLDPTQRALLATIGDVATNNYANGTGVTLDDAIKYAQQDPSIIAKYGDALKLDTQALQQGLADLQFSTNQDAQKLQQQFETDRKALAEQHAAAGTAYSGFRGQAQQKLGTQESGIVESSRRALQKKLTDATQAFESKYGTNQTTPATAQFTDPYANSGYTLSGLYQPSGSPLNTLLTGTTAGGVTGSQPLAKQEDILNKAASTYQFAQLPKM